MKILNLLVVLLLSAASPLQAEGCRGKDLIAAMTPGEFDELQRLVAEYPYAEGNLWQAVRGDSRMFLFGTLHVHDPRASTMIGRIEPLIGLSQAVFVEATTEDLDRLQQKMKSDPAALYNYDNPTLPEVLTEEEWQLLSGAMKERGTPAFLASKLAPWMVASAISVPVCAIEGARNGLSGLDHAIMETARTKGIALYSLEPFDTVLTLFADQDFESQIEMIRMSLANLRLGDDGFITMRERYLLGKSREVWELARLQAYALGTHSLAEVDQQFVEGEEMLIAGRNRQWVEKLLAAGSGKTVFVAAGALHLSGTEGLLNLLEGAGFTLTRLDPLP